MNKKKGLRRFFTLDVHNHEGFTLVELIIVIAILAILSAVAVAGYSAYVQKANQSADDALIYEINQAFRAACIENFHDVYDITAAYATIVNGKVVVSGVKVNGVANSEIATDFATYFDMSNVELKYYKSIKFEAVQFVGSMQEATTFTDEVMESIWYTFDTISGLLEQFGTGDPALIEKGLMKHLSEDLALALGMDGMIDGYIAATNLTDEQLDEYLRGKVDGYDNLTDDEKEALRTRLKANLGVMYFADAADPNDPDLLDKVMASLDVIVAATRNTNVTITEEDMWKYYISTQRGSTILANDGEDAAKEDLANFLKDEDTMLSLTGLQMVAINKSIQTAIQETQSGENTAGVNTLGALYALSAGYFNNTTYWQGEIQGIGTFPAVVTALSQPNFDAYYSTYGRADVEAYLREMGQLSANKDELDLSKDNVFSGLIG